MPAGTQLGRLPGGALRSFVGLEVEFDVRYESLRLVPGLIYIVLSVFMSGVNATICAKL